MPISPVEATDRVSATLPPTESSASQARRLVSTALAQWGAEELHDEAVLLVSELVTNAVVHAGTDIEVAVALQADNIEVAVTDRHPARALPPPPGDVGQDRESGRGLLLTAALAASWGVDYTDRTKRVWFRLPLSTGSVPAPRGDVDDGFLGEGAPALTGVATVRVDGSGLVTDVDENAEVLLGRGKADLVGVAWMSLCEPQDAGLLVTAAAASRWQGSYRVRGGDGDALRVQARHVRLPGTGPRGPETICMLVDHRLRILLGDAATSPVPSAAEGPFATAPEQILRLELDELLTRTAAWARDAFSGDGAYALLVTDDGGLELRSSSGQELALGRVPRGEAEGVTGRVARDLLPVVQDDIAARPATSEGWLREAGVRSVVSVPILAEGRLVGTIGVTSTNPSAFTVDDGARLQRAVDGVALAVQSARVAEIERSRHGWLGYLAEASDLLAGTLELDMALALVVQLVAPKLGPWCAIHLLDDSGRPAASSVWHADEDRIEDLRLLLETVPAPAPAGTRGLSRWLPRPDEGAAPAPVTALDLAEAGGHVVALMARGRLLGTLTVGHRTAGDQRQPLHLLGDLAPRAALALDNAILYDQRMATSDALQRSLLPPELPRLQGVEVGVVYAATGAGNEVGGDFYDIFRSTATPAGDSDRFAFAVGDVCGKGPEAAAVTGLARHALRLLSARGDDIESVLRHLNTAILAEGSRSRFITVIYGEGDQSADGGLDLRFASAGHPLPVALRTDGTAETVGEAGDLLGVFGTIETRLCTARLEPGESLVCFTDGVTERRSGAVMLGEDGVLDALAGVPDLSAPALARRLEAAVTGFAAEPARDDVAVLVLRASPLR